MKDFFPLEIKNYGPKLFYLIGGAGIIFSGFMLSFLFNYLSTLHIVILILMIAFAVFFVIHGSVFPYKFILYKDKIETVRIIGKKSYEYKKSEVKYWGIFKHQYKHQSIKNIQLN